MSAAPSTPVHDIHEHELIDPRMTGGRLRAYCPIHGGDRKRSLSIALEGEVAGLGYCHACEARVRVIELAPSPGHLARQAPKLMVIGYPALDQDGQLVGVHMRKPIRNARGEPDKRMWWEQHKGRSTASMPLYPLMDLLEAKAAAQHAGVRLIVILCEGEHKVDVANAAIRQSGVQWMIAVGTMTGAGGTPCDESLRPLLGCDIWLWPDADLPEQNFPRGKGVAHMERIAARLVALGSESPRCVDWKDAPPKGDAADYFAAGGTIEGLKVLVHEEDAHTQNNEHLKEDDHLSSEWDGGTLLSEVTPVSIDWLWQDYIPLGKLTMGDGDPGLGKTTLYSADIAARVTIGAAMPDGSTGIEPAGVVIFTAEDDPADTLQPRFVAAGGDVSKVVVVTTIQKPDPDGKPMERLPTFSDTAFIERKIAQVNARLVIFDPFMAYLPSTVNSSRDQDIRSALAPLVRLAQKTGAAFLLIRHLNKGTFGNALYRGGGSIGIIGTARSGRLVVKDPDDENVRIFGSIKSNLGKSAPSWKYSIVENASGVPFIQWGGQSERSALDLLNVSGERDTTSKLDAACDLLRDTLSDGAHAEEALKDKAKEQGISLATLRRAKKMLGVESEKVGIGKTGYWLWTLPAKGDQSTPKDAHTANDDHLKENTGHNGSQQADSPKGDHGFGYEHLNEDSDQLSEEDGGEQWIR